MELDRMNYIVLADKWLINVMIFTKIWYFWDEKPIFYLIFGVNTITGL